MDIKQLNTIYNAMGAMYTAIDLLGQLNRLHRIDRVDGAIDSLIQARHELEALYIADRRRGI